MRFLVILLLAVAVVMLWPAWWAPRDTRVGIWQRPWHQNPYAPSAGLGLVLVAVLVLVVLGVL
jgi:hypothetical protein